mgnify:CR=1 FL=1
MELKRYDVVLVDFGTNIIGSEQGGIRPAIVVQNDIGTYFSTTTIVMPLTKHVKNLSQPTHTLIIKGRDNGLNCDSMALGEGLRQVSVERVLRILGSVKNPRDQREIKRVYNASFGE